MSHDAESDLYDPNDEAAVPAFWSKATIKRGLGCPAAEVMHPTLNMRVDAEVLATFKATGLQLCPKAQRVSTL